MRLFVEVWEGMNWNAPREELLMLNNIYCRAGEFDVTSCTFVQRDLNEDFVVCEVSIATFPHYVWRYLTPLHLVDVML